MLLGALVIFCLRIGDVSAATLRVIFLVNGRRLPATCLAFCESVIWVIAISQVFKYLDRWQNMVAYACGYAAGTLVGITLDQIIGIGTAVVRVFTKEVSTRLRDDLAAEGYGVTLFLGEGVNGPVQELIIVIPRRRRKALVKRVCQIDPDAFITVESAAATYGGYLAKPVTDHNK